MSERGRVPRSLFSLLELLLKKFPGPSGWRPAGAVRELPPLGFLYDPREERRADGVFRILSDQGFGPKRIPLACEPERASDAFGAISAGLADCWSAVVLEPDDPGRAATLGHAFREFAHVRPDVVALVVGPLPSHAEILDRYRHVVTAPDEDVAPTELAAGLAHASAARVAHVTRLWNVGVRAFAIAALLVALVTLLVGWRLVPR
ncbi:MAG TPA: hypothetical protein VMS88_03010 [Terriglobales bacterium]|nr:hypothetical protein [Terriglobales bacterium]